MGREDNLRTFKQWITAHQEHDLDQLLEYVTDDVTVRSAAGANMPPANGKAEARRHWEAIYSTFPDMRMEELATIADDDTVFAEISHGGTMNGPMGPHQPTGQPYRVDGAFRIDFVDGRISSILSYWDTVAMMRQLAITS